MSAPRMFRKDEVDGKTVIDASGKAFGKAKDIAFGLDGSVALIVTASDNSEVAVSLDRVTGVSDYILIRGEKPEQRLVVPASPTTFPTAPAPTAGNRCKRCMAPLKPAAKFCTNCGTPA